MGNYDQSIPWLLLKAHFEARQHELLRKAMKTAGPSRDEALTKAQVFEELLNLPETLAVLNEKETDDNGG